MDRRTAKELLHVEGWLARAAEVVARGKDAYLSDAMLQEAGDSLMMKLGEAAGRLDDPCTYLLQVECHAGDAGGALASSPG